MLFFSQILKFIWRSSPVSNKNSKTSKESLHLIRSICSHKIKRAFRVIVMYQHFHRSSRTFVGTSKHRSNGTKRTGFSSSSIQTQRQVIWSYKRISSVKDKKKLIKKLNNSDLWKSLGISLISTRLLRKPRRSQFNHDSLIAHFLSKLHSKIL